MKQPKFKIGDKVILKRKTRYNETEGEIVKVDKVFQEIDQFGNFKDGGLNTSESTIKSIQSPYTFDGETLKVEQAEMDLGSIIIKACTRVSKFKGYAYTIKTPKINTSYLEHQIKSF